MSSFLLSSLEKAFKENHLVFIVGPSASGKSALALEAARSFDGEIVSCDAMQVYREVDVASDKPSLAMRAAVTHHLVDVVSVEDDFNAARYRALALPVIEDILKRGRKAVVCGGSGMYMMALLDGLFDSIEVPEGLRDELLARAKREGLSALHQQLQKIDPQAAAKINPNDQVRIVRALEIFQTTGQPISQLQKARDGLWGKMPIGVIGLDRPREVLYARADARVDDMFRRGLLDEVRELLTRKLSVSAERIIGIPELKRHFAGDISLDDARALIKKNTRNYIKRQLTWFRRDKRIEWIGLS